jgi:3-mercaptopyruvate sulfurtransferase SseA
MKMRKVGSLTALALACATAIILNAACKAGDQAGAESASTTSAPSQVSKSSATPHPTSTPGDSVRRISSAETKEAIEKGTGIVVDVRPKAQYDQGHIKGSVSIPRNELPNRLSELPKDKLVIFYCA